MWKSLQPPYFLTFEEETKELYYIGVTDFRRYWIINTSKKSFLADLKKSNDGLEVEDENELLQRGLEMVANPEELQKVTITQRDNAKNGNNLLVICRKEYEYILKLELSLIEASSDDLFAAVIQPLLKTVCDLRSSQKELREALLKKDKEIKEYKLEGKAPKHLKTTVYDDGAHMKKYSTYEGYFNDPNASQLLQDIAFCSTAKRKRASSPKVEEKVKQSEENSKTTAVPELLPVQKQELAQEVKSPTSRSKQRKRLNY